MTITLMLTNGQANVCAISFNGKTNIVYNDSINDHRTWLTKEHVVFLYSLSKARHDGEDIVIVCQMPLNRKMLDKRALSMADQVIGVGISEKELARILS